MFDYAANHPAAEVLSWDKPRLMLFRSFLTPEEVQVGALRCAALRCAAHCRTSMPY